MSKKEIQLLLNEQKILNKIYVVRGEKIMLDRDLAELYGTETKVLKQAVKRNILRFPKDFMFEMTANELKKWKEGAGLSPADKQGLRYPPFCFTEQGLTMLSCILNSKTAIEVNIRIVRVFVKMREYALTNKEILFQLARLEKEDLASVKMKGKWGFIDRNGAIIIPFKYDFAFSFSDGLVRVQLNYNYRYINKKGVEYWED